MRTAVLEDGALVVLEGDLRPSPGRHQILVAVKACVAEVRVRACVMCVCTAMSLVGHSPAMHAAANVHVHVRDCPRCVRERDVPSFLDIFSRQNRQG